jgi:NDP-sugar pyrophosphorylase family protein
MKAMLLAAGRGTRLKSLTAEAPKALVEIGGVSLLERAVNLLRRHGVEEIIVNVHHFAGMIEGFLEERANFGMPITLSDERGKLLDTGGGLKKAAWFFEGDKPFFIYNVDVLTDLDLGRMYRAHLESGGLATLAVRRRQTGRQFLFDPQGRLAGWRNRSSGETRWCAAAVEDAREWAFSGIQVLNPDIFRYFPTEEAFSLVELYLRAGDRVRAYAHDETAWMDAGKWEEREEAERLVALLDAQK